MPPVETSPDRSNCRNRPAHRNHRRAGRSNGAIATAGSGWAGFSSLRRVADGKRAPQRQACTLQELRRSSGWLDLPLKLTPTYAPVAGDDASQLIITNEFALAYLPSGGGLSDRRIGESHTQAVHERYAQHIQAAPDAGVFGAPILVIDREMFCGQDQLELAKQRLFRAASRSPAAVRSQVGGAIGGEPNSFRGSAQLALSAPRLAKPARNAGSPAFTSDAN